jgi:hypothetical protein
MSSWGFRTFAVAKRIAVSVIASEAKQSIARFALHNWIASSLALLAMTVDAIMSAPQKEGPPKRASGLSPTDP